MTKPTTSTSTGHGCRGRHAQPSEPAFAPRQVAAARATATDRPGHAHQRDGGRAARPPQDRPSTDAGLAGRLSVRGPSDVELAWWAVREPALAGLTTFDALRSEMWDPAVPPGRKDARLAALVRLVPTYGDGPAEAVMALLVPGMAARISAFAGSLDREEAWAEMAAATYARIVRYATAGPPAERVASKLLGAGTKAMAASRDRHRAWTANTVLCECVPPPAPADDEDGLGLRAVLDDAVAAGVIAERDATLIAATRIGGLTVAAAGRLAGISYHTAAKRRRAAEAALVAHHRRRWSAR